MMGRMARTGSGARGALASLALLVCLAVTACTTDQPAEPPPSTSAPAALRVRTVHIAGELDPAAQAEAESAVADVLSSYVVRAFLGDYPREDFVNAFGSFTGNLARDGVRDLDVLTANRLGSAEAVRATRLDADLSFVVNGSDTVGATAAVRFEFEATVDGEKQPFDLRGRLMLMNEDDTWSVYGYDVFNDTGEAVQAGVTS
jgi:hypothetical protein